MNEIRYKLKLSKLDKAGRAPVFLYFAYDGQELWYFTKEKCKPDQRDTDKQKFRRSMPGYQEANEGLGRLTDRLRKIYRDAVRGYR